MLATTPVFAANADSELQDLTIITTPAITDVLYIVGEPAGNVGSFQITVDRLLATGTHSFDVDGRVTIEGGDLAVDTNILFVDSSAGNVGIGTSAPSQKLEINGDLKIAGDDLFMNTNTDKFILVADGTNFNPVESTGDVIIANTGAATIQANAIDSDDYTDGSIDHEH